MNIPDKAMDAAFQAATGGAELHIDDRRYLEQVAKDMLEAAAPFIAAQALRDEAAWFRRHADTAIDAGHKELSESYEDRAIDLDISADDLDPQ